MHAKLHMPVPQITHNGQGHMKQGSIFYVVFSISATAFPISSFDWATNHSVSTIDDQLYPTTHQRIPAANQRTADFVSTWVSDWTAHSQSRTACFPNEHRSADGQPRPACIPDDQHWSADGQSRPTCVSDDHWSAKPGISRHWTTQCHHDRRKTLHDGAAFHDNDQPVCTSTFPTNCHPTFHQYWNFSTIPTQHFPKHKHPNTPTRFSDEHSTFRTQHPTKFSDEHPTFRTQHPTRFSDEHPTRFSDEHPTFRTQHPTRFSDKHTNFRTQHPTRFSDEHPTRFSDEHPTRLSDEHPNRFSDKHTNFRTQHPTRFSDEHPAAIQAEHASSWHFYKRIPAVPGLWNYNDQ